MQDYHDVRKAAGPSLYGLISLGLALISAALLAAAILSFNNRSETAVVLNTLICVMWLPNLAGIALGFISLQEGRRSMALSITGIVMNGLILIAQFVVYALATAAAG